MREQPGGPGRKPRGGQTQQRPRNCRKSLLSGRQIGSIDGPSLMHSVVAHGSIMTATAATCNAQSRGTQGNRKVAK
jgi:hypothetical protein